MTTHRRISLIVGALFLISYVGVFGGATVVGSALDPSTYLETAYPNQSQVILGMLIQFVNDAAIVGIGVMLYPVFRKFSMGLALGYISFRVMEAIMLMLAKVSLLALIPLSEQYLAANTPDAAPYQAVGAFTLGLDQWAGSGILAMISRAPASRRAYCRTRCSACRGCRSARRCSPCTAWCHSPSC